MPSPALSRKSLHTDIRDNIHSQRNQVFEDKGKYVTLSQDHSLDRLADEEEPDYNASQNIKSLHMSAKITPRSSSNFKGFRQLLSKRKI